MSRSYRFPYAYVAWHSGPVGIDIEQITRCDETLADLICTPDERRLFPLPGDGDGDEVLTALWSSKEALTKALGDAVLYDPSRLDAPSRWVEGRSGPWHFAQLPSPAGHVAGMCWADSRGPRRPSERSQQVV